MSADRAAAVERVRQAKSAAVIGSVLLFGAVTGTVAVAQANTGSDTSSAVVDDTTTTDSSSSFFDDGDSGVTGSGGDSAVGGTNVS